MSYIQGVPSICWQLRTKFWKLKNHICQKVRPVLKSLNKNLSDDILKPSKIKLEVFLNWRSKKSVRSEKWFCAMPPLPPPPPPPPPRWKKLCHATFPPPPPPPPPRWKNMPGGGGGGGYGGGRVAWHNVILSDCSFISMHTKVTLVLKLYANVIITHFFYSRVQRYAQG